MILIINNVILPKFILLSNSQKRIKKVIIPPQSKKFLEILAGFLDKNKINNQEIKGITVVLGGGSFTDSRKAVVVANLLAEFLKIKIGLIKPSEFKNLEELITISQKRPKKKILETLYEKEPNITLNRVK